MQTCLNVFWETPNNAVQLVSGADGNPEAWVTAFGPAARERWNFKLLRFVASQHPQVHLGQLNITNGTTGLRLAETSSEAVDSSKENRVMGSFARDEERLAELIQRQQQLIYDRRYGPNRVLVLAEVSSAQPASEQKARPAATRQARPDAPPQARSTSIWLVYFKGQQPERSPETTRMIELPNS